jgi:threonine dehydratase
MKNSDQSQISIQDINQAQQRIASVIRRTPLLDCLDLIHKPGVKVTLKLENLQITGSFKIRGATNKLLSLSEDERAHGVITVSSGNHGRAVSYAARELGIRAVVCLPETVTQNKVEAIRSLGAEVVVKGSTFDEADAHAHILWKEIGLTFVHPYDDPEVISGQGTIGLEMLEDFPEIDTVVVPLSGGGLLSGIALALKSTHPELHVVGVSMERGPAMVESLKAGKVVEIVEEPTLADALAGGIGFDNRYTFQMIQQFVDETVLVSEGEIAHAMDYALQKQHLVIEGGGAVGLAAVLKEKVDKLGENIAVVISGGNVAIPLLFKVHQEAERTTK